MFIGEYNCKVDNKGRIILPAKLREQLPELVILTRGLDNCIELYPEETWNEKKVIFENMKTTSEAHRKYSRFVFGSASDQKFDNQGRITISSTLIRHGKIQKEVVVIGNNDKIEIWDKDIWEEYISDSLENIEDIVEGLDF